MADDEPSETTRVKESWRGRGGITVIGGDFSPEAAARWEERRKRREASVEASKRFIARLTEALRYFDEEEWSSPAEIAANAVALALGDMHIEKFDDGGVLVDIGDALAEPEIRAFLAADSDLWRVIFLEDEDGRPSESLCSYLPWRLEGDFLPEADEWR